MEEKRNPSKEQLQFIQDRIKIHKQKATEIFGEENLVGVFVFGSWNVGSWYEGSDVDTIVLINSKKHFEELYHLNDGTGEISYHIAIDKLLEWYIMGDTLSTQLLEIWGTPYFWINQNFKKEINKIQKLLPNIVKCNKTKIYQDAQKKWRANFFDYIPKNATKELYNTIAYRKACYHGLQIEPLTYGWINFKSFKKSIFYCQEHLKNSRLINFSLSEITKKMLEDKNKLDELEKFCLDQSPKYLHSLLQSIRQKLKRKFEVR